MDTSEDHLKVYVSRLPFQWNDEHLRSHFHACFGSVISASIVRDKQKEQSLGYGYVVFSEKEARETALLQGSLHAKKRNIKISAVERINDEAQGLSNNNICYLWQRFQCVKGENCKFKHEGVGKCITVSLPGEGKTKKCLSFKSKGKCSKGDACPFIHIYTKSTNNDVDSLSNKTIQSDVAQDRTKDDLCTVIPDLASASEKKGICNKFKKGKCRKGDACIFKHISVLTNSDSANNTGIEQVIPNDPAAVLVSNDESKKLKKRKIDGSYLVQQRKKALTESRE